MLRPSPLHASNSPTTCGAGTPTLRTPTFSPRIHRSLLLPSSSLYDATSLPRLLRLLLPSHFTNETDFPLCHRPSYSSPCICTRVKLLWTPPRCLVDPLTLLHLTTTPDSHTRISHGFACITKNICRCHAHLTALPLLLQLQIDSTGGAASSAGPHSLSGKVDSQCSFSSAVQPE